MYLTNAMYVRYVTVAPQHFELEGWGGWVLVCKLLSRIE